MSSIWQRIFGSDEPAPPPSTPGAAGSITGPDQVLFESAIPEMLDAEQVVMGTPSEGLYQAHTGDEIHAMSALLTFENGERTRVGVGSAFSVAGVSWVVTGFEGDEGMRVQRGSTLDLKALALPTSNPVVFPDAEVSNLWIQKSQSVVAWAADMSSVLRSDPSQIAGFIDAVLEAGVHNGVLQIHEVTALGYRDVEDGPFPEWVKAQRVAGGPPDLLGEMGGLRSSAVLAFYNKSGRLIESPVQRLDLVLGREEPTEGAFDGFMEQWPPITIYGPSASVVNAVASGEWDRRAELRIELHSDIWFPWINGVNHPLCDYKRSFDNRRLAMRHTPRLNAFLAAVADAAEAAGGTFGLDADLTNVRPEYVTDRGIVLDGPEPQAQFTQEDMNAPWK